jgi:hypothetical protein
MGSLGLEQFSQGATETLAGLAMVWGDRLMDFKRRKQHNWAFSTTNYIGITSSESLDSQISLGLIQERIA